MALLINDSWLTTPLERSLDRVGLRSRRLSTLSSVSENMMPSMDCNVLGLITKQPEDSWQSISDGLIASGWEVAPVTSRLNSVGVGPVLGSSRACFECWSEREIRSSVDVDRRSDSIGEIYNLTPYLTAELVSCLVNWLLNKLPPPPSSPIIRFNLTDSSIEYSYISSFPECKLCNSDFMKDNNRILQRTISALLRGE